MRSMFFGGSTALLIFTSCLTGQTSELSASQKQLLAKGYRFNTNGWIYLHIEGEPPARGFQHGYLLAPEIADDLRIHRAAWEYRSGMTWDWIVTQNAVITTPKVDAENLAEIDGIVAGLKAAGVASTRDEIVAYNAQLEMEDYWWPKEKKHLGDPKTEVSKDHCSAFIATGSYTKGGGVVMGHNTMFSYVEALANVVIDIVPTKGEHILMQTQPGFIHSGTDFFMTSANLVGCETTIGQFSGFDTNGTPEFSRMRHATQYAHSINEWCQTMKKDNNGGYANAWLVGDVNSSEIARLELGLKNSSVETTTNGYYAGSNVSENRALLRQETERSETDIRKSAAARRLRWKQLMAEYKGRITVKLAEQFLADDYDVLLKKHHPGSRTLDGHFELDDGNYGGGEPFHPSGTFDGKVVDAAMARQLSFIGRWGSADGRAFSAANYLREHPQYEWITGYLKDRPSEPWTVFRAGEKR